MLEIMKFLLDLKEKKEKIFFGEFLRMVYGAEEDY
jgi:hypothetical protein